MLNLMDIWGRTGHVRVASHGDTFKSFSFIFPVESAHLPILNVGCGDRPVEGYVNTDHISGPGVDFVFDADGKWPFEDNSFKAIILSHVFEHLDDVAKFFEESSRVCCPGGTMVIRVPHPRNTGSLAEPDHRRLVSEAMFYWCSQNTLEETHNLDKKNSYPTWEIKLEWHRLNDSIPKWFPIKWKHWMLNHLWNVADELIVWMKPIKKEVACS